jgi:hypothetical protein
MSRPSYRDRREREGKTATKKPAAKKISATRLPRKIEAKRLPAEQRVITLTSKALEIAERTERLLEEMDASGIKTGELAEQARGILRRGRPKTYKEPLPRATFVLRPEIMEALRLMAAREGCYQRDILENAIKRYQETHEKKHGRLNIKTGDYRQR